MLGYTIFPKMYIMNKGKCEIIKRKSIIHDENIWLKNENIKWVNENMW